MEVYIRVLMSIIFGINLNFILISMNPPDQLPAKRVIEIQRTLTSPDSVVKYLSRFKYKFDQLGEPDIKPSGLFLKDRIGDCKDFTWFANEVAIMHKIDSRMITMWPGKNQNGHAVCLWLIDGKTYPLCNVTCIGKYKARYFTNMNNLLEWYREKFNWGRINDWWVTSVVDDDMIPDEKYVRQTILEFKTVKDRFKRYFK